MKSSASAAPTSSSIASTGCLKETSSLSWRSSSMAMVRGCWERVWTCGPGMPRASFRPEGGGVLVDLARPLGAGHGEAVARIHFVQKLVYLKVVQHSCLLLLWIPSSLSCRCGPVRGPRLRPRGRTRRVAATSPTAVASRLSMASSVSVALPASLRRVSSSDGALTKTITASGRLFLHLPRALELYLQDHGLPFFQELLDLLLGRPIEVTRVLGPLQESALLDPTLELLAREEDVVSAVLPRRDGDRASSPRRSRRAPERPPARPLSGSTFRLRRARRRRSAFLAP